MAGIAVFSGAEEVFDPLHVAFVVDVMYEPWGYAYVFLVGEEMAVDDVAEFQRESQEG